MNSQLKGKFYTNKNKKIPYLLYPKADKVSFFLSRRVYTIIFGPGIVSVGGVMVSIDAFQALDPGSIPGHRNSFSPHHFNTVVLFEF